MMDWYFGKDDKDCIVPNDQEISDVLHADDRSPCPNGWLQWEAGRTESFVSAKKSLSRSIKPIGRGSNSSWQSLFENFDLGSPIHDGEVSTNQSTYGDFSLVDSCARTSEASFHDEKMDDFWESAFVEDPLTMNVLSNSHNSTYGSMPFGNLLADMLMDPHDSLKDPSIMGGTCYSKMSFGPLINDIAEDENQLDDVSPSWVTDNYDSPEGSPTGSVLSVLVPAEQNTSEIVGHVQEKRRFEATALQELEDVMTQLNMETRICFRDALYRLAKISKRHHSFTEDKPSSEVDCEISCHGRQKSGESKTNAIDRTVANLMFNQPNSGPPGISSPRSVHQCVESCQKFGCYNNIPTWPVIHSGDYQPTSLPWGIKLPSCRKENCEDSHSGCILSYLMPTGAEDYVSDMTSCQAEDSVAMVDQCSRAEDSAARVDQFGSNQHPGFTFMSSRPHRQDG